MSYVLTAAHVISRVEEGRQPDYPSGMYVPHLNLEDVSGFTQLECPGSFKLSIRPSKGFAPQRPTVSPKRKTRRIIQKPVVGSFAVSRLHYDFWGGRKRGTYTWGGVIMRFH